MTVKVKDIMTRTSVRFYDDDEVNKAIEMFYDLKVEAGLVFSEDQLVGMITIKDLMKGIALKKKRVGEVQIHIDKFVHEDETITMIDSINCNVYPVRNQESIWTGYVNSHQLLDAKANQMETEKISLNAIFQYAHNGIIAIDNNGYITAMNPAAEQLTNLKKEECLGKFLADVGIPTELLDVAKTGKKQTNKYNVGKRKFISNRTPIIHNGKTIGAVGVFQNISDITDTFKELRNIQQVVREYDYVLDFLNDASLILDRYGAVLKANTAFKRVLGTLKVPKYYQELLGNYFENCVVTDIKRRKKAITYLERNKQNGNPILIRAAPIQTKDEGFNKIVVTIRDLSVANDNKSFLFSERFKLHQLFSDFKKSHILVTQSKGMKKLKRRIYQYANNEESILIEGESGTGKERIARIIHASSNNHDAPFIKIESGSISNISTIDKTVNGMIYFNEIEKLPNNMQLYLLNLLYTKPKKFRVVAGTNTKLKQFVEKGIFCRELFEVLSSEIIYMPSLRERVEDIPLLVSVLQDKFSELYNVEKFFSKEAIESLEGYNWPGNILELMNVIERLITITPEATINRNQVEDCIFQQQHIARSPRKVLVNGIVPLKDAIGEVEQQLITQAMALFRNTRKTASALGVNQSTVVRKMQKYAEE
ncbi:sigma 54-interacting transcriptional regulator [Oceanobacillus rekensis]|uniref:sigma 54-interacting transcriptional regulator n=1 Tax=Oceanobacillus rekensis TaxID=937927 RepID=UPI000B448DB9|nr:sigma 54-interacting transcriptional regulator [Oceanobacillus rekensis]